ncbi:hypothetical protein [Butyrivibrio proteoclasticus]|uniref:hypothetical protein n=1 Tax=Butyrivibrio proteoclasticus TaxID=43305 RepID=UPI00068757E7|nr:hypothetical protein [Butyrivibrio proteoclasticus]
MEKSFKKYKFENDLRNFMNINIWRKLERHGFSTLANRIMRRNKYGKRSVHGDTWTREQITSLLRQDKPCMIARFGLTEMNYLYSYLADQRSHNESTKEKLDDAMERLCLLSGFFPNNQEYGEKFAKLYFESIPLLDLCGVWNLYMEDYVLDCYAPNCELTELKYLEPWNSNEKVTWSAMLKGKKVLVIHPFSDSIEKQYKNHKYIFSNRFLYEDILPEFELQTIKAVQSLGGENDQFNNWFEAFNAMVDDVKERDFDIAIIGCGAYGLPLAAEIKKMGKKAIHLGGATQLMFGIWGHRWDQIPEFKNLRNEYWIHPSEDEKPKRADEVENGCYW